MKEKKSLWGVFGHPELGEFATKEKAVSVAWSVTPAGASRPAVCVGEFGDEPVDDSSGVPTESEVMFAVSRAVKVVGHHGRDRAKGKSESDLPLLVGDIREALHMAERRGASFANKSDALFVRVSVEYLVAALPALR